MLGNGCFSVFLQNCCNILSPSPIWFLAQQYPHMWPECQSTARLFSKLFCSDFFQTCIKCGNLVKNLTLRNVLYFNENENLRKSLCVKFMSCVGAQPTDSLYS